MKKLMFSALFLSAIVCGLWSQVAFSFKSDGSSVLENGIGFDLGYKLGPIAAYAGVTGCLFHADLSVDGAYWAKAYLEYPSYGYDLSSPLKKTSSTASSGSIGILCLIPTVGARFYLPTVNKVSPYIYANVFKVFTTIDMSLNATGSTYNTDGTVYQEMSATSSNGVLTISNTVHNADGTTTVYTNTQNVKKELDAVTSLLSPYGGNLGIGATYAIDDGLDLFGEFGVQGMLDSMSYGNEFPYKQSDVIVSKATIASTLSAMFGLTRVAIGIRFNWL